jgi:hypothetical protein
MVIAWIATRPHQLLERGEISRPCVISDCFDHLHRNHCVVTPFDVAVVAEVDRHQLRQPCGGNPKPRQVLLFDRQGHRADVRSTAGGADTQLAPSSADLEKPTALVDSGEVEQSIDFVMLCRSQIGQ